MDQSKKVPLVCAFLEQLEGDAHLSVITLHEPQFGIFRHPDARRRQKLTAWLDGLEARLADFILPVVRSVGERAARLRHRAERQGRTLHLADALIAGTAEDHRLRLVARNVRDFESIGVPVVDPFAAPTG